MKYVRTAITAVLLFLASCAAFAQPAEKDAALEAFKAKMEREFKANGESAEACKITIVDREPGGPGRIVVLHCPNMKFVCAFLVMADPENQDGFSATTVQCAENPDYVKRHNI
jgi:hypothetical protein